MLCDVAFQGFNASLVVAIYVLHLIHMIQEYWELTIRLTRGRAHLQVSRFVGVPPPFVVAKPVVGGVEGHSFAVNSLGRAQFFEGFYAVLVLRRRVHQGDSPTINL